MNLLSIADLNKPEVEKLIRVAEDVKKRPGGYKNKLKQKVLLTFFQMPSLRTEVSFDVAMFKMGGEIVDYHSETSPWAAGKETIEDVAKVLSRYVDCVMIRMHDHKDLLKFAKNSSIPVINGLTSQEHPCQVLSDLLTIKEEFGNFKGLKLAYLGDSLNNTTHSLILACAMMGIDMVVICPKKKAYMPDPKVLRTARKLGKGKITVKHKVGAVEDADIVYTDSWMSYRISKKEKAKRTKDLKPYQVNKKVMKLASHDAIFMHDLPALRGQEVTKDVMDGDQSVVWDQAENRMHMEKAILLKLIG